MRHDDLLSANCAIRRTGAILGERWVFAILHAAFTGARTFEQYQGITGMARNTLTDRLGDLVELGILRRVPYQEHERRTLHQYRLTDAGIDLYPIVVAIMEWGNAHAGLVHGPPVELVHDRCGEVTHPRMTCDRCGEPIHAREVHPQPGPGADQPSPPVVRIT